MSGEHVIIMYILSSYDSASFKVPLIFENVISQKLKILCLLKGIDCVEDPQKAIEMCEKEFAANNLEFIDILALELLRGKHIERNITRAIELLELGIINFNTISINVLAGILYEGKLAPKDIDRSLRLLEFGVELGDLACIKTLHSIIAKNPNAYITFSLKKNKTIYELGMENTNLKTQIQEYCNIISSEDT